MVVGHLSRLLVDLLHTRRTVYLLRAKVPRAIQRNEVASSKKNELVQFLAPLKLLNSIFEHWPETYWLNIVEDGAHLCVAGNMLYAVDALQVAVRCSAFVKRQQ